MLEFCTVRKAGDSANRFADPGESEGVKENIKKTTVLAGTVVFLIYRVYSVLMQRFFGTDLGACIAQDALRGVFALSAFFVDLDVHRADLQAFAALDTFAFIAMYAQE